jgi:crotonobetainyl-CoA:carnitine CoA-transferase CaiB-like acyl-CoA transferase
VIADPQVREMGWITTVESPILGAFETLATPFKIYGADIGPRGAAPELGQDTSAVLGEWGLGEDEVQAFAMDGVLG